MLLCWLLALLLFPSVGIQPKLPKHVIPLYGNVSLGYYYANIYVGFPAQKQSVIIDTGSGQLALPCSKCQQCGKNHLEPPFQLSESKDGKMVTCTDQSLKAKVCGTSCFNKTGSDPCTFSISYAEGSSLSGIMIEDSVQFEGDSQGESIKTVFGCTLRETNLFYKQAANGIFGLSPKRQFKLLQQLQAKHFPTTGEELLFSLCLAKNGGQMVVGQIRPQIHRSSQSVKTSFNKSRSLYILNGVGQVRMGSQVLKDKNEFVGSNGVFIDSGSTFTYMPEQNYDLLLQSLIKACSKYPKECFVSNNSDQCFKIQTVNNQTVMQAVLRIFPAMQIQINNNTVLWSSADYFILVNLKTKEICLGILPIDRFILGATWMANRDIVFDLKNNTIQIFSNSSCQIPKSTPKNNAAQSALNIQTSFQKDQLRSEQQTSAEQEMPEFVGAVTLKETTYVSASFKEGMQIAEIVMIILISAIVLILTALIIYWKCFKSQPTATKDLSRVDSLPNQESHSNHFKNSNRPQESTKREESYNSDNTQQPQKVNEIGGEGIEARPKERVNQQ